MATNNPRIKALSFFLTIGIIFIAQAGGVHAQTAPDKPLNGPIVKALPEDAMDPEANALLSGINDIADRIQRYFDAYKSASAEDRLVFDLQIWALQQKAVAQIQKLTDHLVSLEKKTAQPALRKQVQSILAKITPRFVTSIEKTGKDIDNARARRTDTSPEDRPALEDEVRKLTIRLDQLYKMSLANLERMDAVGLNTKIQRSKLMASLTDRVAELSGRIALATERIARLEILKKDVPDDANISKLYVAALKSLDTNTASMNTVLDLMEKSGLDTKEYREQLVAVTKDISSVIKDTGVAIGLASKALKRLTAWFLEKGPGMLLKAFLFFGIVYLFIIIKHPVKAAVEKAIGSSNMNLSKLASHMVVQTSGNLVLLFGFMIALSQVGIDLGPLLAGLGVFGFIAGFALQDSLSNFASGAMILLYRPYDVGDLIDVGGVYGKVEKMSLVSTHIATLDNQVLVIPNNKIWGDVIKNVNAQKMRRVDMVFGIGYSDDIETAEGVLKDILTSHEKVLSDPEPMVRLHTLNDSSVDFIVRPWTHIDDYWDVYWDVTKTVKRRFDEAGISIPFPQRDVHLYREKE